MNHPTGDDLDRIEAYRKTLGKYPKPSVTADIVAVRPAFGELRDDQWRENPKFALEILLIKRGLWPHEGDDVKGGDDAAMARWLRSEYPVIGDGEFRLPFYD